MLMRCVLTAAFFAAPPLTLAGHKPAPAEDVSQSDRQQEESSQSDRGSRTDREGDLAGEIRLLQKDLANLQARLDRLEARAGDGNVRPKDAHGGKNVGAGAAMVPASKLPPGIRKRFVPGGSNATGVMVPASELPLGLRMKFAGRQTKQDGKSQKQHGYGGDREDDDRDGKKTED